MANTCDRWDPNAPRDGVTVIRRKGEPLNIQIFAPILMQDLGMLKADATHACARQDGLFLDNIDAAAAQTIADALHARGEECLIVPASEIVPLPANRPVHSAELHRDGVILTDAAGQTVQESWGSGLAVAAGHVVVEVEELKLVHRSLLNQQIATPVRGWRSGPGPQEDMFLRTGPQSEPLISLVFADLSHCYRIYARAFDYEALGDQLKEDSAENFLTLARWLLYAMPRSRTNIDAPALEQTGTTALPQYPSEVAFHGVTHWLINLALRDKPNSPG